MGMREVIEKLLGVKKAKRKNAFIPQKPNRAQKRQHKHSLLKANGIKGKIKRHWSERSKIIAKAEQAEGIV